MGDCGRSAFGFAAVYAFGMGCLMMFESLRTKLQTANALLSRLSWTGNETVLDIGCGRGGMLVAAAKHLTSGHATGIDIWRQADQSSNSAEAAMRNARYAKVTDKVSLQTADMRHLPFVDHSFDVVVSSWAVHNLNTGVDRAKTLAEIARMLRPDGQLILIDIVNHAEYMAELARLRLRDIAIVVASPLRNRITALLSFGAYEPTAILARGALS